MCEQFAWKIHGFPGVRSCAVQQGNDQCGSGRCHQGKQTREVLCRGHPTRNLDVGQDHPAQILDAGAIFFNMPAAQPDTDKGEVK